MADFSVTISGPSSVDYGATATFSVSVSGIAESTVQTYNWSGGSGSINSGQGTSSISWAASSNTSLTSTSIRVDVTDDDDDTFSDSHTVTYEGAPPAFSVDILGNNDVLEGAQRSWNASLTNALSSDVLSYAWSLDGSTGSSSSFVWVAPFVSQNTNYTISLTVELFDGRSASDSETVRVLDTIPPPDPFRISINGPSTATSGDNVSFSITATNNDGIVGDYEWSADGGSPTSGTSSTFNWTAPTVSLTTNFTISVSAIDSAGDMDSDTHTIAVSPSGGPQYRVSISGTSSVTAAPIPRTYNATVEEESGATTPSDGYSWSRSGGSFSGSTTGSSVTWTNPNTPGTYTLSVTATNSAGTTASDSFTVTVTGPPPDPFSIDINGVSSIDSGDSTTFSITADNNDGIVGDYDWSADGGSPTSGSNSTFGWTAPTVTSETTVDIDCSAIDSAGTMATASTHTVTVTPSFSVAITSGANTVASGQMAQFSASATGITSSQIASWGWASTQGSVTNNNNPVTIFTAPIVSSDTDVTIEVTVTHNNGSSASGTRSITISPTIAPTVNITTGSQTVDGGESLNLFSTVTGFPIPTLSWTGSGTFDDDDDDDTAWEAPSPTNQTDYVLRLTATNSAGMAFDEVTITVRGVSAVAPTVTINTANMTVDSGAEIALMATVTGFPTPALVWSGSGTFDDTDEADTDWNAPTPSSQMNYTLRLTATNAEGSAFDEVEITVRAAPVVAPSNSPTSLSESSISQTSVSLSWSFSESLNTGDPATGFDIGWRLSSQTSYNIVSDNSSPYSLTGLSSNTSYTWYVRATNAGGNGPWSSTSSFTTLAAPTVVIHTSDTTVDSGTEIALSATVTGNPNPTLSWSGGGTFDDDDDEDTDWTAPTVTSQTAYTLRLTANNTEGSNFAEVTITVNPPPTSRPSNAPTGLSESNITSSSASLSWSFSEANNTGSPAAGFDIRWRQGNSGSFDLILSVANPYTLSGLNSDTFYQWGVRAKNSAGNGPWSSPASFTTDGALFSPAVTIHTSNTTIDAGARVNLSSTVTGNPNPTLLWTGSGDFDDDDDDDTFWDAPSPTNQTNYVLRLTATNSEGTAFAEVTITVRGVVIEAPTNAPTNLSESNIDQISARLSWSFSESQNNGDPATGFDIDWRRSSDSSYIRRTDSASPYSLSGLSHSTSYRWRVRARNSGGNGPWSSIGAFTTDTPPPILTSPNVTVHTANMTVAGGATVNLDASVSGNPTPNRTWSASPNAGTFGSTTSIDTTWEAPSPMAVTQYTLTLRATNSEGEDSDSVIMTVMAATVITLEATFLANAEFSTSLSGGRAISFDQPDVPYLPSDGPVLGFFELSDIITHNNLNEMGPKLITTTEETAAGKRGRWNLNVTTKDIRFDDGLAWQSAEFGFQILGEDGGSFGDHSHRILDLQPESNNDNWIVYDYTTNTDVSQEREFRITYNTTWNNNESMLVVGSCYVDSEVASGRIDLGYTSSVASSAEVSYTVTGQSSSGWRQLGQNDLVRFEVAALVVNNPSNEGTIAIKLTVLDRTDNAGQLVSGEDVGDNRLSLRATRIHIA